MAFSRFAPYAGDPILTLNEEFRRDPRPHKINLGIGVYTSEDGTLPVMSGVRETAPEVVQATTAWGYLPMAGHEVYRLAVQSLLFGSTASADRLATIQTLGGSGALKVGADVLRRHFPDAMVWISDPTWDNHRAIFEGAGFEVRTYPYFDAATGGVDFGRMLDTLRTLPPQSIVVLHACCHNPTGADLSAAQWVELIGLLKRRALIPFVDAAYLGFGSSLEDDAFAIRELARQGVEAFVAVSFSKNFALYGERCGALSVLCTDPADRALAFGQLQLAVRRIYSSPPMFGAQVVAGILGSPARRERWAQELEAQRQRIVAMRGALHAALAQRLPEADFGNLLRQRGMFSYTGLSGSEVDALREEHGVYLVRSGRLCIAGLNPSNVGAAADAIAQVLALRSAVVQAA